MAFKKNDGPHVLFDLDRSEERGIVFKSLGDLYEYLGLQPGLHYPPGTADFEFDTRHHRVSITLQTPNTIRQYAAYEVLTADFVSNEELSAVAEVNRLTRELAQCADELAFWKYQAVHFHARLMYGVIRPSDENEEYSEKFLEEAYKTEVGDRG